MPTPDPIIPPAWQLPEGVDAPLWTYAHTDRLATDDDAYFANHPLLEIDLAFTLARLSTAQTVADLGCGTGRAALALARLGIQVLAVDLSPSMLVRVAHYANAETLPVKTLQANLCDLGEIPSASHDAALLLFSTLGMIRTQPARRRALAEAARIVRPGGSLILHAHNLWQNFRNPDGRRWLLAQTLPLLRDDDSAGDRPMTYRGIPNLIVHQYRLGELRADLHATDWQIVELIPINPATARPIPAPNFLPGLRPGGWLLAATRTERNL